MRTIRPLVACFCLITTLAASAPCRAESGGASEGRALATSLTVKENPRLDLTEMKSMSLWDVPARPSSPSPLPLKANMQTNGGSSHMSAAKKTWIIVGIVVGAALVVSAVSNNGGGSGGGGY